MDKKSTSLKSSIDLIALKHIFNPFFKAGVAIGEIDQLSTDEIRLILSNFNCVTPENCMKPKYVHPTEFEYTFSKSDQFIAFAVANELEVNGHTLVWHNACPSYFFEKENGEVKQKVDSLKTLKSHISTVVGRYRGQIKSWDVVNEALSDKAGEWLRPSKWFESTGPEFILEAFFAAHEADPEAILIYNDYNIEEQPKLKKCVELIQFLQREKAPIHGVGIQGHYELCNPNQIYALTEAIKIFADLGVSIQITELDIDPIPRGISGANVQEKQENLGEEIYPVELPNEMQFKLAEEYVNFYNICHNHSASIRRITFWGLHDGNTWLNNWPKKRVNHPLFWDRNLNPKETFTVFQHRLLL